MHPKKLKNVMAMSAQDRYWYFVRKVADLEIVWGLRKSNGLWIVSRTGDGTVAYPFWPEREFAEAAAIEEWSEAGAAALPLDEFMGSWLPGMQQTGEKVGIFWVPPDMVGIDVEPGVLSNDLRDEWAQYE